MNDFIIAVEAYIVLLAFIVILVNIPDLINDSKYFSKNKITIIYIIICMCTGYIFTKSVYSDFFSPDFWVNYICITALSLIFNIFVLPLLEDFMNILLLENIINRAYSYIIQIKKNKNEIDMYIEKIMSKECSNENSQKYNSIRKSIFILVTKFQKMCSNNNSYKKLVIEALTSLDKLIFIIEELDEIKINEEIKITETINSILEKLKTIENDNSEFNRELRYINDLNELVRQN